MAFMSNEWMEPNQRCNPFRPHSCTVDGEVSSDYSRDGEAPGMKMEFRKTPGFGFQYVWLSHTEVNELLPNMGDIASESVRLDFAIATLLKLTDTDLMKVLASLFAKRVAAS